jgi:hypothetical protein
MMTDPHLSFSLVYLPMPMHIKLQQERRALCGKGAYVCVVGQIREYQVSSKLLPIRTEKPCSYAHIYLQKSDLHLHNKHLLTYLDYELTSPPLLSRHNFTYARRPPGPKTSDCA